MIIVAICSRVMGLPGAKCVLSVPLVTPASAAQMTALKNHEPTGTSLKGQVLPVTSGSSSMR